MQFAPQHDISKVLLKRARKQGVVAWEILVDQDEQETVPTVKHQYELQVQLAEPIVYVASSDPDILYLHEAMKAPDRPIPQSNGTRNQRA